MENVVEIEIRGNTTSLKRAGDEAKIYARDTKKELEKSLLLNLEINVAQFQSKLEDARKRLAQAKKEGDKESTIELRIETNKLTRNLTEAKRQLNNYVNTGDKDLSRLQSKFDGISSSFIKFGQVVGAAIAGGIAVGAKAIIGLGANLEQATIAFTTMLGSAEKAKELLQDLSDFALKTPFELTGIRETAKQLLAMGVNVDNLIPTMKMLGDVSAGLSVPLERLALAYGQVLSKGRLQGGELKQFTEAGVPLIETLSKQLGVSAGEFYKMMEAGKVSAVDVTKAFETMTSEGGKFGNLMEQQSKTLAGMWSNLKDSITKLGESLGTSFLPILKTGVDNVLFLVDTYGKAVLTITTDTISVITQLIGDFMNTTNILFNSLSQSSQDTGNEIQTTFGQKLLKVFSYVISGIQGVIFAFKTLGAYIFTNISNNAKKIALFGNVIGDFGSQAVGIFKAVGSNIGIAFMKGINTAIGGINKMIELINNIPGVNLKKIGAVGGDLELKEITWKSPLEGFDAKMAKTNAEIADNWSVLTDYITVEFDKMADSIDKRNKDILNSTKLNITSTNKEIAKIDYSKILGTTPTEGTGGAKKQADDLIKIKEKELEEKARLEILAIKGSELSELQKAKSIVEINKRLQKDLLELKGDTIKNEVQDSNEIIKIAEETEKKRLKTVEDFYNAIDKKLEESEKDIESYKKKVGELNKEFEKLKKDAVKNIQDINYEISKGSEETEIKLAERILKALDEQEEAQKRLNELKREGVEYVARQFEGSQETLKGMETSGVEEIGGIPIKDITEYLSLLEKQKQLQEEISLATKNSSEEIRNEIKRVSELSETEKLLEDQRKNEAILEERKKIYEAIRDGEVIILDEIQNYENQKLAEQLIAKQTELEAELELARQGLEAEKQGIIELYEEKKRIEKEYTNFFMGEIDKKVLAVRKLASEYKAVMSDISQTKAGQVINNNTTTNVGGVTANNNVDLELIFSKLNF